MPLNVVLITVDDMNWDAVAAMGRGDHEVTPNINRLAGEGLLFRRAHVTAAICQPSRQAMMTGRYPHNSGAPGFDPIASGVPVVQDHLREAGYLLGILGKVQHLAPVERFGWDYAQDMPELAAGRDPKLYGQFAREFLGRAKADDRPFFLMVNSHDPHRPFHGSEDEKNHRKVASFLEDIPAPSRIFEPHEVTVPAFLPDLPDIRREVAQYCSSCRRADDTVGEALRALEEAGLADNTLVMFLSDNGMAFPFAKTNCYLNSTRTPWIVRWPGVVEAGRIDAANFVSGIDFAATILEACELPALEGMDGRSFLPLLRDAHAAGRDHVVTHINTIASKREYPMRAVHFDRFGYIFSAWSDGETRFRNESMSGLTWNAIQAAAGEDPTVAARAEMFVHRVPEELYDYSADPDALNNLADDPAYSEVRGRLRELLLAEMRRTGDPVLEAFESFCSSKEHRGRQRAP